MVHTIVLNSRNIINDGFNNKLTYSFPQSMNLDNHEVTVSAIQMFYSWFNISSNNNNNSFQYRWFNGTTYNVNIPDGFYSIEQLNAYLQNVMITNLHYMVSSATNNNVYFLSVVTNPSLYACQINSYPLSSAYATTKGWTLPSGATWTIPSITSIPSIIISSNKFTDILGIRSGTYPVTSGALNTSLIYSKTSDYCPQVSPTNSLMVRCNMVSSKYGAPNDIITSFAPNVTFGSLIDYKVSSFGYNSIYKSIFSGFTITILDQDLRDIKIIDPSIVITLLIREKSESK
jgi:hypothetical protein